jgi:hypothetical protein
MTAFLNQGQDGYQPPPPWQPAQPPPACQPNGRSGSGLGSSQSNPRSLTTGSHFGHHKTTSSVYKKRPKPPQHKPPKHKKHHGKKAKQHRKHKHKHHHDAGGGPASMLMSSRRSTQRPTFNLGQTVAGFDHPGGLITYMPKQLSFVSTTMDVYTGNATVPPPAQNKRTTATDVAICGTFLEGSRIRSEAAFAFTHILLCDAAVEIRDGYISNATPETVANQDLLQIPSGSGNWWRVILSHWVLIPTLGRRKVIIADRQTTPTNWPQLL